MTNTKAKQLLLFQSNASQQILETGIVPDRVIHWIHFDLHDRIRVLRIRFLQQVENSIFLAGARISDQQRLGFGQPASQKPARLLLIPGAPPPHDPSGYKRPLSTPGAMALDRELPRDCPFNRPVISAQLQIARIIMFRARSSFGSSSRTERHWFTALSYCRESYRIHA